MRRRYTWIICRALLGYIGQVLVILECRQVLQAYSLWLMLHVLLGVDLMWHLLWHQLLLLGLVVNLLMWFQVSNLIPSRLESLVHPLGIGTLFLQFRIVQHLELSLDIVLVHKNTMALYKFICPNLKVLGICSCIRFILGFQVINVSFCSNHIICLSFPSLAICNVKSNH